MEVRVIDLRGQGGLDEAAEHRAMALVLESILSQKDCTNLHMMMLVGCAIDYFQGIACDHIYTREVHNQLEGIRLRMQPVVLEALLSKPTMH